MFLVKNPHPRSVVFFDDDPSLDRRFQGVVIAGVALDWKAANPSTTYLGRHNKLRDQYAVRGSQNELIEEGYELMGEQPSHFGSWEEYLKRGV